MQRAILLLFMLLLVTANALGAAGQKQKRAANRAKEKQVTVTLVRWPYS